MNKDTSNVWFWPTLILAICILLAPIGIGYFYYFPFDDAFISFRITENFIQNRNALYNPDTKLYTSTSLLYPFWNAIWCKILGKNWIYQISIINGILQSIAIGRILFEVLKNSNSYKVSFFVLLAICPLCFNLTHLVYGNTGLETGLYQCFLAFSLCSLNPGKIGWISGLVRPEGFLVGLAGVIGSILNKVKLNKILIQTFWGIGFLSAYFTISYLLFDDVIPQSIIAKSNYAIDRFDELKSGYLHNFFQGYGFYTFLVASTWFYFPNLQKKLRIPLTWLLLNGLFFSALASW